MGPTLDPYGFGPKTAWRPSRAGGESWMSSSDKSRLVCSAVYSTREFNHHYAVQCIPPTSRVAPNRRLSSNPSQSIGRPCDAAAGGHDARFCPFLQGIPRLSHILLLKPISAGRELNYALSNGLEPHTWRDNYGQKRGRLDAVVNWDQV